MINPSLVPCGGCHRHVRAAEPTCPFCAHPLADSAAAIIVPEPGQRLSRAGVLAFAAAFLSSACQPRSGPTVPDPSPPAVDAGMMQTIYGGPPEPPPPPPVPGPNDLAVPAYGGPPPMPPIPPAPPSPPVVRPPAHQTHHPVAMPAYGASPVESQPRPPTPGSMSTRYGAPPRPTDDSPE